MSESRYAIERTPFAEVAADWEAFHRRAADPHPFASRAWLETMATAAGLALDACVVRKGAEWVCAIAVPHRAAFGRRIAAGLPLAAYSPLLARGTADGHPASRTHEHLEATARIAGHLAREYELVDLLLPLSTTDVRSWIWGGWRVTPRYTYLLPLAGELRLADSVRRHLRKCGEAGLVPVVEWDFDAFWTPFSATRTRQGFGTVFDRPVLERAATALHAAGEAWMVGIREPDGRWAAGQILLGAALSPVTAMWLAGSDNARLATGVSSQLMVASAEEARRRGHGAWDLCGADLPGEARFKAELGGDLRSYFQVTAPRSPLGALLRLGGRAARALRGARGGPAPARNDA